jgi:hypothetical protein
LEETERLRRETSQKAACYIRQLEEMLAISMKTMEELDPDKTYHRRCADQAKTRESDQGTDDA